MEPDFWGTGKSWLRKLDFNPKATGSHKICLGRKDFKVLLVNDMGVVEDRLSGERLFLGILERKVLGRPF